MFRYGIFVTQLRKEYIMPLQMLGVESVQIPFHIGLPPVDYLNLLKESGVMISAKYVPHKGEENQDLTSKFRNMFLKYKSCVDIWEFGGEPESRPGQHDGCRWWGTAKQFCEMLRTFTWECKSINPKAKVACGGFISATYGGLFEDDRTSFLKELAEHEAEVYIDVITINQYVVGYGGLMSMIHGIPRIREFFPGFPISISEVGVTTNPSPLFKHISQSEKQQACWVYKILLTAFSLGIQSVTWFKLDNMGVFDRDWTIVGKLSFDIYRQFISLIGNKKIVRKRAYCNDGNLVDHIWWYVAEDINIIWTDEKYEIQCKFPKPMRTILNKITDTIGTVPVLLFQEDLPQFWYDFVKES
jgi:hypothetical protein